MRIEILASTMVTDIDSEAVIINLMTEHMYGLNPVATQMWKSLEQTHDTEATLQSMLKLYEVSEAQLEADLHELVQNLEKHGIIRVVEQTT